MSTSELRRTEPGPDDALSVAVSVSPATGRVTVVAAGEVDIVSAERLGAALTSVLDHPPSGLDVDLGQVTMLDSTGISVLMSARARAAAAGCQMTVTAVQPYVRRVLGICGLLDALNVAP
ncbi:MAG TPA: STAS domain-containing protein [Micromonosporaceae bacterium]|nr:STAS domain-containing protein [Micromonosporaceae bacterium]